MEQINGLLFFFLMILLGYFAAKARLLPAEALDVLPAVLLHLCYPAMILEIFTQIDTASLLHTLLPVALATLGVTAALFFGALWVFRRQPARRKPLLCMMIGIGNTSYVAIPLLSVFLSAEGMLIAVVNSAVQDILIWTLYHPLFLGAGTKDRKELLKKIGASPCLLAVVAGVVLAACRVTLPSFLQLTVSRLSDTTAPVALLFLGALICRHGLLAWRRDRTAMVYAPVKVLLLPLAVYAALRWFLPASTTLLLAVLFASPAPLTAVVWSRMYDSDERLAVNGCISSTLLYLAVAGGALYGFSQHGLL